MSTIAQAQTQTHHPTTLIVNGHGRTQMAGRIYQFPNWVAGSTLYTTCHPQSGTLLEARTMRGEKVDFEEVEMRGEL